MWWVCKLILWGVGPVPLRNGVWPNQYLSWNPYFRPPFNITNGTPPSPNTYIVYECIKKGLFVPPLSAKDLSLIKWACEIEISGDRFYRLSMSAKSNKFIYSVLICFLSSLLKEPTSNFLRSDSQFSQLNATKIDVKVIVQFTNTYTDITDKIHHLCQVLAIHFHVYVLQRKNVSTYEFMYEILFWDFKN